MKEGWENCTLGEICQIKPPKKEARNQLSADDMVSFVPMTNLGVREKSFKAAEDRPLQSVSGSYTYFAEGDVLLAKITPCFENGKLGIARGLTNGVGFGSSEFIVFRPKEKVDAEYLFYFLSQDSFRDSGAKVMSGAVGHKRVPKEFINDFPLPLPSLPEQKRIVAILDEAFAGIDTAIANTEKNLANARELFESYLNAVFSQRGEGWELKKLGEVTTVQSGGTPLRSKPEYWDGDIPWYSSGELNDLVATAPARYITEKGLINSNAKIFSEGSLLIGMYDTAALKMAILDREAAFNQAIAGATPSESLDLRFVYFAINAAKRSLLLQRRGVRQKNLSLGKIKNIEIPTPPLAVQRDVAERLLSLMSDIDRLHEIEQQKLTALAELKQSLLQKAFSGELTADPGEAVDTVEAELA
ncbi:MAG: restriction endonuclease subunit S [Pseudomonadota bacterium]